MQVRRLMACFCCSPTSSSSPQLGDLCKTILRSSTVTITDTHTHLPPNPLSGNLRSVYMSLDGSPPSPPLTPSRPGDVFGLGVHPWYLGNLPPPPTPPPPTGNYDADLRAMISLSLAKPNPLTSDLKRQVLGLPNCTKYIIGECGLDKVAWKRSGNMYAQLSAFLAHVALGLPMSMHCVKAGRETRMCLEAVWGRGGGGKAPTFVIVHGFCFREQEVVEWEALERRVRKIGGCEDFRVYFGLCPRHVKVEVVPERVHGRCLVESDMAEGRVEEQREMLARAASMCGGGEEAERRWIECLKKLPCGGSYGSG